LYNSLQLGEDDLSKNIRLTGVSKSNSLFIPVEFKNWKVWEK